MGYQYKYNFDFFKNDSEELYYFLGFVAADGYLGNDCIEIGLNKKDLVLLEQFRDLICPKKKISFFKKTNSYRIKFSLKEESIKIHKFLGLTTNKKSKELKFPSNIPEHRIKDFIRGYIDGDGCIDSTKGYYKNKIYLGIRLRILGTFDFLFKLNEITKKFCSHNTNTIAKRKNENVFEITYNFKTAENLLKWIYENNSICLQRKYDKYKEVLKNRKTIIR